jgi:hypothetical protein
VYTNNIERKCPEHKNLILCCCITADPGMPTSQNGFVFNELSLIRKSIFFRI